MKKIILGLLMLNMFSGLAQQKPKLIYVADPLCSWCYGFQIEMEQVIAKYKDHCDIQIWVGGMALENKEPLDLESKQNFQEHWKEVQDASGQPFDTKILDNKDLIYNSEPLCRAIVTAKILDSTKALSMHKALQKAFYSQNKNVTLWDNIKECVSQLGMDTVLFARKYHSEEMRAKTQQEFATVEKNGIAGFPALLLVIDNKTILVTDGYTKFKQLDKKLKSELKLK